MGQDQANGRADIFFSTGELSGEMHAANLINALKQFRHDAGLPPLTVAGNGSQMMRAAGVELLHDVATWSEMGILANMFKAAHFQRVLSATARHVMKTAPKMVILVDNRVFNLGLAKILRHRGYVGKIVYFVAPVRWESMYDPTEHQRSLENPRFLHVKKYCDYALPIYPVSLEVYRDLEIPHNYFGHPLCELAKPNMSDDEFSGETGLEVGNSDETVIIGVMPGSRIGEIRQIAPPMFNGLAKVRKEFGYSAKYPRVQIAALLAHPELRQEVLNTALGAGLHNLVLLPPELSWDLMARARMMLVKSGTGLHQCMIMGTPAVMCYRVSKAMEFIAKRIMKFSMPFYGFPNLFAGHEIVPELIQGECTTENVANEVRELLLNSKKREQMQKEFGRLKPEICPPDVLHNLASMVNSLLPATH